MIRFNFIESARPEFLRRVSEFTIPPRLRAGVFAVFAAAGIAAGAWAIESYRVADAELVRARYHVQYEESALGVSRSRVMVANASRLAHVVDGIHRIQSSGARTAQTIAEIGNRLPTHSWVTAASVDSRGVALTGGTNDFVTLSREILSTAPGYSMELLRASRESRGAESLPVSYELRVGKAR